MNQQSSLVQQNKFVFPYLKKNLLWFIIKIFFVDIVQKRINPGGAEHSLKNVIKVTSGSTKKVAKYIDRLCSLIIDVRGHIWLNQLWSLKLQK